MMRQISLRHTPRLIFEIDEKFKKTIETLSLISEVMEELREKEQQAGPTESEDVSVGNP